MDFRSLFTAVQAYYGVHKKIVMFQGRFNILLEIRLSGYKASSNLTYAKELYQYQGETNS